MCVCVCVCVCIQPYRYTCAVHNVYKYVYTVSLSLSLSLSPVCVCVCVCVWCVHVSLYLSASPSLSLSQTTNWSLWVSQLNQSFPTMTVTQHTRCGSLAVIIQLHNLSGSLCSQCHKVSQKLHYKLGLMYLLRRRHTHTHTHNTHTHTHWWAYTIIWFNRSSETAVLPIQWCMT